MCGICGSPPFPFPSLCLSAHARACVCVCTRVRRFLYEICTKQFFIYNNINEIKYRPTETKNNV